MNFFFRKNTYFSSGKCSLSASSHIYPPHTFLQPHMIRSIGSSQGMRPITPPALPTLKMSQTPPYNLQRVTQSTGTLRCPSIDQMTGSLIAGPGCAPPPVYNYDLSLNTEMNIAECRPFFIFSRSPGYGYTIETEVHHIMQVRPNMKLLCLRALGQCVPFLLGVAGFYCRHSPSYEYCAPSCIPLVPP